MTNGGTAGGTPGKMVFPGREDQTCETVMNVLVLSACDWAAGELQEGR